MIFFSDGSKYLMTAFPEGDLMRKVMVTFARTQAVMAVVGVRLRDTFKVQGNP